MVRINQIPASVLEVVMAGQSGKNIDNESILLAMQESIQKQLDAVRAKKQGTQQENVPTDSGENDDIIDIEKSPAKGTLGVPKRKGEKSPNDKETNGSAEKRRRPGTPPSTSAQARRARSANVVQTLDRRNARAAAPPAAALAAAVVEQEDNDTDDSDEEIILTDSTDSGEEAPGDGAPALQPAEAEPPVRAQRRQNRAGNNRDRDAALHRRQGPNPIKKAKQRMEEAGCSDLEEDGDIDVTTVDAFVCAWARCGNSFNNKQEFLDHVRFIHVNPSSDYACLWDGCLRRDRFRALYMLVVHVRRHTGEKPHRCPRAGCFKAYSRLENLKTHERSHSGEKPYACAQCGKAFSNASDRAKHTNRTHSGNLKPYECGHEGCRKAYTDPSSLRKHIKTAHGDHIYEQMKNEKLKSSGGRWPRKHYYNSKSKKLAEDATRLAHGDEPGTSGQNSQASSSASPDDSTCRVEEVPADYPDSDNSSGTPIIEEPPEEDEEMDQSPPGAAENEPQPMQAEPAPVPEPRRNIAAPRPNPHPGVPAESPARRRNPSGAHAPAAQPAQAAPRPAVRPEEPPPPPAAQPRPTQPPTTHLPQDPNAYIAVARGFNVPRNLPTTNLSTDSIFDPTLMTRGCIVYEDIPDDDVLFDSMPDNEASRDENEVLVEAVEIEEKVLAPPKAKDVLRLTTNTEMSRVEASAKTTEDNTTDEDLPEMILEGVARETETEIEYEPDVTTIQLERLALEPVVSDPAPVELASLVEAHQGDARKILKETRKKMIAYETRLRYNGMTLADLFAPHLCLEESERLTGQVSYDFVSPRFLQDFSMELRSEVEEVLQLTSCSSDPETEKAKRIMTAKKKAQAAQEAEKRREAVLAEEARLNKMEAEMIKKFLIAKPHSWTDEQWELRREQQDNWNRWLQRKRDKLRRRAGEPEQATPVQQPVQPQYQSQPDPRVRYHHNMAAFPDQPRYYQQPQYPVYYQHQYPGYYVHPHQYPPIYGYPPHYGQVWSNGYGYPDQYPHQIMYTSTMEDPEDQQQYTRPGSACASETEYPAPSSINSLKKLAKIARDGGDSVRESDEEGEGVQEPEQSQTAQTALSDEEDETQAFDTEKLLREDEDVDYSQRRWIPVLTSDSPAPAPAQDDLESQDSDGGSRYILYRTPSPTHETATANFDDASEGQEEQEQAEQLPKQAASLKPKRFKKKKRLLRKVQRRQAPEPAIASPLPCDQDEIELFETPSNEQELDEEELRLAALDEDEMNVPRTSAICRPRTKRKFRFRRRRPARAQKLFFVKPVEEEMDTLVKSPAQEDVEMVEEPEVAEKVVVTTADVGEAAEDPAVEPSEEEITTEIAFVREEAEAEAEIVKAEKVEASVSLEAVQAVVVLEEKLEEAVVPSLEAVPAVVVQEQLEEVTVPSDECHIESPPSPSIPRPTPRYEMPPRFLYQLPVVENFWANLAGNSGMSSFAGWPIPLPTAFLQPTHPMPIPQIDASFSPAPAPTPTAIPISPEQDIQPRQVQKRRGLSPKEKQAVKVQKTAEDEVAREADAEAQPPVLGASEQSSENSDKPKLQEIETSSEEPEAEPVEAPKNKPLEAEAPAEEVEADEEQEAKKLTEIPENRKFNSEEAAPKELEKDQTVADLVEEITEILEKKTLGTDETSPKEHEDKELEASIEELIIDAAENKEAEARETSHKDAEAEEKLSETERLRFLKALVDAVVANEQEDISKTLLEDVGFVMDAVVLEVIALEREAAEDLQEASFVLEELVLKVDSKVKAAKVLEEASFVLEECVSKVDSEIQIAESIAEASLVLEECVSKAVVDFENKVTKAQQVAPIKSAEDRRKTKAEVLLAEVTSEKPEEQAEASFLSDAETVKQVIDKLTDDLKVLVLPKSAEEPMEDEGMDSSTSAKPTPKIDAPKDANVDEASSSNLKDPSSIEVVQEEEVEADTSEDTVKRSDFASDEEINVEATSPPEALTERRVTSQKNSVREMLDAMTMSDSEEEEKEADDVGKDSENSIKSEPTRNLREVEAESTTSSVSSDDGYESHNIPSISRSNESLDVVLKKAKELKQDQLVREVRKAAIIEATELVVNLQLQAQSQQTREIRRAVEPTTSKQPEQAEPRKKDVYDFADSSEDEVIPAPKPTRKARAVSNPTPQKEVEIQEQIEKPETLKTTPSKTAAKKAAPGRPAVSKAPVGKAAKKGKQVRRGRKKAGSDEDSDEEYFAGKLSYAHEATSRTTRADTRPPTAPARPVVANDHEDEAEEPARRPRKSSPRKTAPQAPPRYGRGKEFPVRPEPSTSSRRDRSSESSTSSSTGGAPEAASTSESKPILEFTEVLDEGRVPQVPITNPDLPASMQKRDPNDRDATPPAYDPNYDPAEEIQKQMDQAAMAGPSTSYIQAVNIVPVRDQKVTMKEPTPEPEEPEDPPSPPPMMRRPGPPRPYSPVIEDQTPEPAQPKIIPAQSQTVQPTSVGDSPNDFNDYYGGYSPAAPMPSGASDSYGMQMIGPGLSQHAPVVMHPMQPLQQPNIYYGQPPIDPNAGFVMTHGLPQKMPHNPAYHGMQPGYGDQQWQPMPQLQHANWPMASTAPRQPTPSSSVPRGVPRHATQVQDPMVRDPAERMQQLKLQEPKKKMRTKQMPPQMHTSPMYAGYQQMSPHYQGPQQQPFKSSSSCQQKYPPGFRPLSEGESAVMMNARAPGAQRLQANHSGQFMGGLQHQNAPRTSEINRPSPAYPPPSYMGHQIPPNQWPTTSNYMGPTGPNMMGHYNAPMGHMGPSSQPHWPQVDPLQQPDNTTGDQEQYQTWH
ncbi:unnamed protein product, partial [Mesorhabditis spiculigera]